MKCKHCGSKQHTSIGHNEVLRNCKALITATDKWKQVFQSAEEFQTYKQKPGAVSWSDKYKTYIGIAADLKEVQLPSTPEQCEAYLQSRPNPIDW